MPPIIIQGTRLVPSSITSYRSGYHEEIPDDGDCWPHTPEAYYVVVNTLDGRYCFNTKNQSESDELIKQIDEVLSAQPSLTASSHGH